MVLEVLQSSIQVVALLSVVYGEDEEVDEPGQGVLVHGVDVG